MASKKLIIGVVLGLFTTSLFGSTYSSKGSQTVGYETVISPTIAQHIYINAVKPGLTGVTYGTAKNGLKYMESLAVRNKYCGGVTPGWTPVSLTTSYLKTKGTQLKTDYTTTDVCRLLPFSVVYNSQNEDQSDYDFNLFLYSLIVNLHSLEDEYKQYIYTNADGRRILDLSETDESAFWLKLGAKMNKFDSTALHASTMFDGMPMNADKRVLNDLAVLVLSTKYNTDSLFKFISKDKDILFMKTTSGKTRSLLRTALDIFNVFAAE